MINLFRNLRILHIAVFSILGAVWLGCSGYFIFNDMYTAFCVSLAIWWIVYFVLLFVFAAAAVYKHDKLAEVLNDECDVIKFLNEYYPLLQRAKDKKTRALVILNLALGYIDAGDINNAKNALCSLNITDVSVYYIKVLYYSAWTQIYKKENDIQNAKQTLGIMKDIIDKKIKKPALKENYLRIYNVYTAEINLNCGCYDGVEEILRDAYSKAEKMVEKVSIQYILSQFHLKTGRIDDAKYSLRFVAENGSTLAIAAKAKQTLNELSQPNTRE